jgi:serine/threonine-protein kinase HipA
MEKMAMNHNAKVILWGNVVGAVSWLDDREIGVFQYHPDFLGSGIELSPLIMPLRDFPYEFPALPRNTFKGLPGLLADALPDKFGNALIDEWLASEGRTASSFHPVERLCYIGSRGMGALEFEPAAIGVPSQKHTLEVSRLVDLANQILDQRKGLGGVFTGANDKQVIDDILRVGTSAGGARAKAILAWNQKTGEFCSGQVNAGDGFEHWLMKFDGVSNNRDKELADPKGYGKIEYAYSLMAAEAGIKMSDCCLHHEDGRSHFMTKRFDRTPKGRKIHMQSLGAIAHYDYNQPASYSYEQAIQVMKRLDLSRGDLEQQVLRAFFNVVARNQDDHVKNIAFLMDRRGQWSLSPAFDVTYAYDPKGDWTSRHQMSIHGKRAAFIREDLIYLANQAGIKKSPAIAMLETVTSAVKKWELFAEQAEVPQKQADQIKKSHRSHLLG